MCESSFQILHSPSCRLMDFSLFIVHLFRSRLRRSSKWVKLNLLKKKHSSGLKVLLEMSMTRELNKFLKISANTYNPKLQQLPGMRFERNIY